MASNEWQEGGCFCGDVRYRVRGEVVWKSGCTCNTCVKIHGVPYVVWAGFDRCNYGVIQGEPVSFRSSKHVIRQFCPRCGTTLNYGKDARGVAELEQAAQLIYIAVATLDDPTVYPPDEVVHTQERISWLHLGNEIPLREFISPEAGNLQFGGIDEDMANELVQRHFSSHDSDNS